jgi:hypothetical protein
MVGLHYLCRRETDYAVSNWHLALHSEHDGSRQEATGGGHE